MYCIGLFGTCGNSNWRKPFIEKYQSENIPFFNPQVKDWAPENAVIEAEHLNTDSIILFPVTRESYGFGSLAEIGFAILNIVQSRTAGKHHRYVIVFVDPILDDALQTNNPTTAKESTRARILVREHMKKLEMHNVFCVDSLQEMLDLSVKIHTDLANT